MTIEARLAQAPFSPERELGTFTQGVAGAGAVVSFTGLARSGSKEGRAVRRLVLEHHPRLTTRSLETIAHATEERFRLRGLLVVHRCGVIGPGEAIVFVAAASAHRRDAFEAVDYAMDRLKSEAMFWKREDYDVGSAWIEPTEADAHDLARWSR